MAEPPEPIDEVEAFRIAKEYVMRHGPDYWLGAFTVALLEDKYHIRTNCIALGGSAVITINPNTGEVEDADWNSM